MIVDSRTDGEGAINRKRVTVYMYVRGLRKQSPPASIEPSHFNSIHVNLPSQNDAFDRGFSSASPLQRIRLGDVHPELIARSRDVCENENGAICGVYEKTEHPELSMLFRIT